MYRHKIFNISKNKMLDNFISYKTYYKCKSCHRRISKTYRANGREKFWNLRRHISTCSGGTSTSHQEVELFGPEDPDFDYRRPAARNGCFVANGLECSIDVRIDRNDGAPKLVRVASGQKSPIRPQASATRINATLVALDGVELDQKEQLSLLVVRGSGVVFYQDQDGVLLGNRSLSDTYPGQRATKVLRQVKKMAKARNVEMPVPDSMDDHLKAFLPEYGPMLCVHPELRITADGRLLPTLPPPPISLSEDPEDPPPTKKQRGLQEK